jgi:hypothetical protein
MKEIPMVDHNPFVLLYFLLFTGPSFMTHASISSVSRMVTGGGGNLIVGEVEPLGETENPYSDAYMGLINMLLVARPGLRVAERASCDDRVRTRLTRGSRRSQARHD